MAKNTAKTARKTLTGLDQIDANIESIRKRGAALKKDIHTTLIMIVDHAIAHGDDTRVTKFHRVVKEALGSSSGQAIVRWLTAYTTFIRAPETQSDEQKEAAKAAGGELFFYSIPLKTLKASGLEKAIVNLAKPVTSKVHKVDDKALVYPAGMNARELPFYESELEVPQVAVDFQKKFHDMLIGTMRTFKDMQKSDYKGRGIVNLDAAKLTRLADTAIELGFVTAEEVDGFNIRTKEADGGTDLAAEAERHQTNTNKQAEIVPAEKVRGRKAKTTAQENAEPVADAA